ncbi:unnamed protein product [Brassica oleracea var. botrytis]
MDQWLTVDKRQLVGVQRDPQITKRERAKTHSSGGLNQDLLDRVNGAIYEDE